MPGVAGGVVVGGVEDGGVEDGGVEDGGVEDGGVEDGGVEDGGVEDGGVEDGSVEDGSVEDGSVEVTVPSTKSTDGLSVPANALKAPPSGITAPATRTAPTACVTERSVSFIWNPRRGTTSSHTAGLLIKDHSGGEADGHAERRSRDRVGSRLGRLIRQLPERQAVRRRTSTRPTPLATRTPATIATPASAPAPVDAS